MVRRPKNPDALVPSVAVPRVKEVEAIDLLDPAGLIGGAIIEMDVQAARTHFMNRFVCMCRF